MRGAWWPPQPGSFLADDHGSFCIRWSSFLLQEELCAYIRSLPTPQLCRPKWEGMVEEWLFSTRLSPGPPLIAEAGLRAAPLCCYFCGSSVILRTPLRALGYQVPLVAAALSAERLIYWAQEAAVWAGFHWQSVPDLETFDILAGRLVVCALLGISLWNPVKVFLSPRDVTLPPTPTHFWVQASVRILVADEGSTPSCSEHTPASHHFPAGAHSVPVQEVSLRSCSWAHLQFQLSFLQGTF